MNEVEQTARTIMLKLSLPSLFPLEGKMVETESWLIALIEQEVLDWRLLMRGYSKEPEHETEMVKCCLCGSSSSRMVRLGYAPRIQLKTPPPPKRQNNIQDDYPDASATASPSGSEGDDY